MFELTRVERLIVAFLVLGLVLGLGVSAYKKSRHSVNLEIKNFKIEEGFDIIESGSHPKVDINRAAIEDLMRLKGIGEVLAKRIIDYRSEKGRFYSVSDLKNVKGIGDKLFDAIKDDVAVE